MRLPPLLLLLIAAKCSYFCTKGILLSFLIKVNQKNQW